MFVVNRFRLYSKGNSKLIVIKNNNLFTKLQKMILKRKGAEDLIMVVMTPTEFFKINKFMKNYKIRIKKAKE